MEWIHALRTQSKVRTCCLGFEKNKLCTKTNQKMFTKEEFHLWHKSSKNRKIWDTSGRYGVRVETTLERYIHAEGIPSLEDCTHIPAGIH